MVLENIEKYKKEIKDCINDLKSIDTWYKQIPNLLTFSRLLFALPLGFIYYINPVLSIIGITLLWSTDAIDGKIARKLNIQSKLGADMDTIADKIMFLASSIPLMSNIPVLGFNFILEGVISLVNVMGRINGLETKTVMSGKIKTVSLAITIICGYLVQLLNFPSRILGFLVGATTGFQLIAINDYIREVKRMKNELNTINEDKEIESKNIDIVDVEEYDKTLSHENIRNTIDELKAEKEFYLGFSEPDKENKNIRVRKKND